MYLEIATAYKQVDLVAFSLLNSRQHLVDFVQTTMTAAFHSDLHRSITRRPSDIDCHSPSFLIDPLALSPMTIN